MEKYQNATEILLPRSNHAKCPIYQHEGEFYIKANKPNTSSRIPFYFEDVEYTKVRLITGNWFTVE